MKAKIRLFVMTMMILTLFGCNSDIDNSMEELSGLAPHSLVGFTLEITMESGSSDTIPTGQFPTQGKSLKVFHAGDEVLIFNVEGLFDLQGSYDLQIQGDTLIETSSLHVMNGQPAENSGYVTSYHFDTETTGTWTETFNNVIQFTGTFVLRPTDRSKDYAQDFRTTINIEANSREYLIHLPPQFSSQNSLPLLVVLHGQDSNAEEMRNYTELNVLADQEGFVAIYPKSLSSPIPFFDNRVMPHWDVYQIGHDEAFHDVDFIDQLISHIQTNYGISNEQVFLAGFSNGAAFSQRLACELENRFSGLAVVGFSGVKHILDQCDSLDIPVLYSHGTADPIAPFEGFENFTFNGDSTAAEFAKLNKCDTTYSVVQRANNVTSDSSQVTQMDYNNCDISPVRFYRIENGGHTWPGVTTVLPIDTFGFSNKDFNFNEEMWTFFSK